MEINANKITNIVVTLQACEVFYVAGILDNSSTEICYFQRDFCIVLFCREV